MANCPNCGAELAPSVLSCANCRMPLPPGSGLASGVGQWSHPTGPPGQSGHSDHTVVRPGASGYLPSQDASWAPPPQQRAIPLDSANQGYRGGQGYPGDPGYGADPQHRGAPAGSPPTAGYGVTVPPPGPHGPQGPHGSPEVDPRERRQRRNTITLIVLAAVVLAIALVSGLVVVMSINGESTAGESAEPKAPTTAPVTQAPPPPSTSDSGTDAPSSTATTPSPSPTPEKGPTTTAKDAQTCSPGLQVPAKGTTCEFAKAVRAKVDDADPKAVEFKIRAHSSVTKKDYTMSCVRNSVLTTCKGGNDAVVWIHNGG